MKKFILSNKYPIIIAIFGIIISALNYTPGTWQTSWDTLHPEFNWSVNISRHLWGMWQENQGLGNVGGHSHAADLPRILTLFIADLFFPRQFLRYFWAFITFLAGPLGTYFFLKKIVFRTIKDKSKKEIISFVGGLYYMLNLGTIQQFYVQLEMYTTLYGFMPWIFLYLAETIVEGRKKLPKLALAVFLGTPMAYAITVFISFYITLISYTLVQVLLSGKSKFFLYLKRFLLGHLVIIGMSLYWLLPSLYFGINDSDFVSESKINTHFSVDIFAHNVKHGNIKDLFLNKGFLLDWRNYDFDEGSFYFMMTEWNKHILSTEGVVIEFVVVGLLIIGMAYGLLKRKRGFIPIYSVFLISSFMFMSINPPLGFLFTWITDLSSTIREMYRNPYTKFSVQLIFAYSVFMSYFALLLWDLLSRVPLQRIKISKPIILAIFFGVLLNFYMLPIYKGELLSKDVRHNIPNEYFELFDWLNAQADERRVATLPVPNFWGWEYYNWGYQGSGFIWFGAKQSFLQRDFDRWNQYNQQYYVEMSNAIYSSDIDYMDEVIERYGIGYVVFDKNTIPAGHDISVLAADEISKMFKESDELSLAKTFGHIEVYVSNEVRINQFFQLRSDQEIIIDKPFVGQEKGRSSTGFNIERKSDGSAYLLSKTLDYSISGVDLVIPDAALSPNSTSATVFAKKIDDTIFVKITYNQPQIYFNDEPLVKSHDSIIKEFSFVDSNNLDSYLVVSKDIDPIVIEKLESVFKSYGSTMFSLSDETSLNIYPNRPELVLRISYDSQDLIDCSPDSDSNFIYGINHLSLWGFTDEGCVYKDLDLQGENFLFKTNFKYKSQFGDLPKYCIEYGSECLNNISFTDRSEKDQYKSVQDYVILEDNNNLRLKILSPINKKTLSNVEYVDFQTRVYRPIESVILSKTSVDSLDINEYVLALEKINTGDTLTVEIPIGISYSISEGDLFDLSDKGVFEGKYSKRLYEKGLLLESNGKSGQSVQSYDLFDIPTNINYIFDIELFESYGYPLTVIARDKKYKRNYLYEKVDGLNGLFLIAPTGVDYSEGFSVDLVNTVVGEQISSNKVKKFTMIPYSGSFLKEIRLVKNYGQVNAVSGKNPVIINKLTPFLYSVDSSNPEGVMVFETSFHKGWKTYPNFLHFKYLGWANLWDHNTGIKWIYFEPAMWQIVGYIAFFAIVVFLSALRKPY